MRHVCRGLLAFVAVTAVSAALAPASAATLPPGSSYPWAQPPAWVFGSTVTLADLPLTVSYPWVLPPAPLG